MFKAYQVNKNKLQLGNVTPDVLKVYNKAINAPVEEASEELVELSFGLDFAENIDRLFKPIVDISLAKIAFTGLYQAQAFLKLADDHFAQSLYLDQHLEMIKPFLYAGNVSEVMGLSGFMLAPSGFSEKLRAFMDSLPYPQPLPATGSFFDLPLIDTFCNNIFLEDSNNLRLPIDLLLRDGYLKHRNWLLMGYLEFKYLQPR